MESETRAARRQNMPIAIRGPYSRRRSWVRVGRRPARPPVVYPCAVRASDIMANLSRQPPRILYDTMWNWPAASGYSRIPQTLAPNIPSNSRLDRGCRAGASDRSTRPCNAKGATRRPDNSRNRQGGGGSGRPPEPAEFSTVIGPPGVEKDRYLDSRIPREIARSDSRISRRMTDGATPGNSPRNGGECPWKYGPARPGLVC